MAGLDLAARVILETWTGPIDPDDVTEIEARIEFFGSAYGAALQMLCTRRAQFDVSAGTRSAGDDRTDHTRNWARMDKRCRDLASVLGALESYTPSQAETDLMVQALGTPGQTTGSIDMLTSARRRG
jgi:hypothetical protein